MRPIKVDGASGVCLVGDCVSLSLWWNPRFWHLGWTLADGVLCVQCGPLVCEYLGED